VSALGGAIGAGCCWLVAVVFGISAVGKLRTAGVRAAFRRSVADMAVLPARAVAPVAVAVPIVEAAAAVLLVTPPTVALGAALALALLAAFSTGIALVLRRGTRAGCRCFGTTERPYRRSHLVRNALLAAATLAGAVLSGHPTGPPVAPIAIAGAVVAALVLVTFDDLIDLFSPTPSTSGPRK
jgi:methylamine utilization protein MauE